jgi:hypothetical protein
MSENDDMAVSDAGNMVDPDADKSDRSPAENVHDEPVPAGLAGIDTSTSNIHDHPPERPPSEERPVEEDRNMDKDDEAREPEEREAKSPSAASTEPSLVQDEEFVVIQLNDEPSRHSQGTVLSLKRRVLHY